MLQFTEDDINYITKQYGEYQVKDWSVVEFADRTAGALGDHHHLIIKLDSNGQEKELKLFIKCVPKHGDKAKYIVENGFFKKEYMMLNEVFKQFGGDDEPGKWRPKPLFLKQNLFVFEDVTELGYQMPFHEGTLIENEVFSVVKTLARFHAQTYIYEDRKSKTLNRRYRLWDEFSEYLQEPGSELDWRKTGIKAVIDMLKQFSKFKTNVDFIKQLDSAVPDLFNRALTLMEPGTAIRNAVVHCCLWSNNIFLKVVDNETHALMIDFQTVMYSSPMIDLSSMLYYNTTRNFRDQHLDNILDYYYNCLSEELSLEKIRILDMFDRTTLRESFDECVLFGITQAAIIVPITAMSKEDRFKYFFNPETFHHVTEVSRSEVLMEVAETNSKFRQRVVELFDELAEKYL